MKEIVKQVGFGLFALAVIACGPQQSSTEQNQQIDSLEDYRPAYHFSPKNGWMNDPNGLVYLDGTYHLFFQHNPDSNVWGPMHWGHATSTDLVHWEEQEIALFPDSLGTIFSGSAVIDKDNTAGFGANALVAIYTNHSHEIEDQKTGLHQTQSIAYSLDQGKTWTKYEGNPVLPNPGIWDFRDPKVIWHNETQQWIMTLATKQSITFYASKNLKSWERLSEFGEGIGAHGGVWECPDLLRFSTAEGEKWVLLVSINPGGPNTGSATQYFVGDFDGKTFASAHNDIRWMDYGPDNYAGVTFSNTGDRKLLIGWMSNWEYANDVPASTWRSGNTIVRELGLSKEGDKWLLTSTPASEIDKVSEVTTKSKSVELTNEADLSDAIASFGNTFDASFTLKKATGFHVTLTNEEGETLVFGYDAAKQQYFIDRSKAGDANFSDKFIHRPVAPRLVQGDDLDIRFLLDHNSIELFADGGKSNMSTLFFTKKPFTKLQIAADEANTLDAFQVKAIR
ncbi:glycoside hydrolase family 32 protein [Sphingobacterium chuzhouense]|uniref:Glycoside hydrolase family 32 protein n=1 Tax=Sphingobacterium chuzhouense TaxID=1742264 RepID=A0ABR7XQB9_9SPHI|nr:glycoside hydrolase family 32 protein [Sphingobacterium chuzhouense]MBD1421379.1 glycoside hydrolase family 32 protein [Sphingobacterium chuzhouense]